MTNTRTFTMALIMALAVLPVSAPRAQQASPGAAVEPALKPTNHPRVPADLSLLWLAPDPRAPRTAAMNELASAVRLEVDSDFARALPILSQPALQQGTLGHYALYYQGLAELRLGRAAEARRTFQALRAKQPVGYVAEGAALREAECDESLGDNAAAVDICERLSKTKTTTPDDVLLRLGRSARSAGKIDTATEAFSRLVYEFPFSDLGAVASAELETLPIGPIAPGTNRYKLELGRAERLFGAKRYAPARAAFEGLRDAARGDDRELVTLRLAECDYFQQRARGARDAVKPYVDKASRQGEALFFYAVAVRELGDHEEYLRTVRRLVQEFPDQSWAEEGLNNLATHYILQDDDEQADATFREMYEKFPMGHYAERAAWKIGWFAYRNGRYADTVRAFESGAAHFPRSDYRPTWLYWSGRAHDALKEPAVAQALLALELYDQALDELHYAQKTWSDSPAIQATVAWILHKRGDLRAAINAMKRAYPQYMAAGGERLPTEVLKVLFPVNYWPLIRRYSAERNLDPYMVAALILQESNFTADIRSSANAYGLMQILPSTGRQYARSLNLTKRFTIGLLTTAEPNIKMGTAYFADLVRQFGGVHYALATYNAGPNRVARWISERPGIDQDEFIDDIPFPETQNYVKKILGTAEDYRRLYAA